MSRMKRTRFAVLACSLAGIAILLPAQGKALAGVGPANDNFAEATVVGTLPFEDDSDTTLATFEPGDPEPSCAPTGSGANATAATVWFRVTPATDLDVEVSTAGSEADNVLAVYTGPSLLELDEVVCSDQEFYPLMPRTTFHAHGGSTYYIQVGALALAHTGRVHIAIAVSDQPGFGAATVEQRGFLSARDGTELRYDVLRPLASEGTRFPVLINYDYYAAGSDASDNGLSVYANRLLARGYAVMGVSVRGTGCSQGAFDAPWVKAFASDGYDAVEWAATQPWSDGRVGMIGVSAGGISQLYTAGARPPHLKAIAPSSPLGDFYRDVNYPGGVPNAIYPSFWSAVGQKPPGAQAVGTEVRHGDSACVNNYAAHEGANAEYLFAKVLLDHPYADDVFEGDTWEERSPVSRFRNIGVPTLLLLSWQDEQLPSRIWDDLALFGRPDLLWVNVSNGNHGRDYLYAQTQEMTLDFLDHFVRDIDNEFGTETPHTSIGMETRSQFGSDGNVPTWSIKLPGIPQPTPRVLYLRGEGNLADMAPDGPEAADSYAYPVPSSPVNRVRDNPTIQDWDLPSPPGGAVVYTSPPLGNDLVLAGPASLDLWLSSTSADTDVQATVTEVRPDGQETYVQRGWLRASHRKLDPARSTVLRPYQTHARADVAPLAPREATFIRVEIFPFAHAFRAGSRLRVWIDAPASTGAWGFTPVLDPGINSVLHDADHPSRLVVGVLDGEKAQASWPACDTLRNQPCRPDPLDDSRSDQTITSHSSD